MIDCSTEPAFEVAPMAQFNPELAAAAAELRVRELSIMFEEEKN